MIREDYINNFLNGRQFYILTAVLFVLLSWFACDKVNALGVLTDGVCFSTESLSSLPLAVKMLLGIGGMVGVSAVMSFLNKASAYVREVTYIFASTYLLLGIANPLVMYQFFEGTILSAGLMLLTTILFSTYQDRTPQRRVYLVFALTVAGCLFNYVFGYLLIALFVGFMQMRAMNVRSVLAMLFGIATPLWIVLGTGIVDFAALQPPHFAPIWQNHEFLHSAQMLTVVGTTILLTLVLFGMNVLKLISYKLQTRSYNGFFIVVMFLTIIMMVLDGGNILAYLSVLNICLSVQMAHAFTIRKHARKYILYLIFMALCVVSYVWHTM